jgi:YVTN family beta-propeller protein
MALLAVPAQAQTRAYVANSNYPNAGADTVSVIDTATNTVVATVGVGINPFDVAITPDGTRAYEMNQGSSSVSVIDTTTNTVVATVGVGGQPQGVAITPDGTSAYVTNAGSNSVSVIDTATNTVVATFGVGSVPYGVAIHTLGIGPPTTTAQCKKGGWQTFNVPRTFKNQGDCVSFVKTGK